MYLPDSGVVHVKSFLRSLTVYSAPECTGEPSTRTTLHHPLTHQCNAIGVRFIESAVNEKGFLSNSRNIDVTQYIRTFRPVSCSADEDPRVKTF